MKQNLFRPYNFLTILGMLFITISFFLPSSTLDVHFHDTFYVIAYPHFFWFIAILFLFFALFYKITSRILLSKYLSWIHIILMIISLSTLFAYTLLGNDFTRRYIDASSWTSFNSFTYHSDLVRWCIGVFIICHVLFLVNIIAGAINKFSNR